MSDAPLHAGDTLEAIFADRRFVVWRWETRSKGERTKVPYVPGIWRKAESDNPFEGAAGARLTLNRLQDLVNAALEQIVLVAEMRIERRPADICSIENLFHSDRWIRLFAGESDERFLKRCLRSLYSAVWCFRTIAT